ncbi:MFS transporter [Vibrio tapetis subsp. quintayensis]|uniref:MFS transporter n=1 Tax=Vibrio tapetis TaxID=52443 RepID=UPI0025B4DD8E|nr:MFS transporter [Vibrio tapetis]MDN3680842.1 MFS transporter [Vibrio tapetis subsp. quintayensis]
MKNRTLPYLSGRFFDGISSGLFMMALPWLMLQTPNMGTFVALTALTCTAISFLVTPFFANLTDQHSRKHVLILVQVVQSATAAIVLMAYLSGLGSNWVLAASQLIFWVSSNIAWHANSAFTQENYEKHEYAKISGYQEIVMQGTTLGAGALGIVLLEHWGMQQFALFATMASGIAAISYLITPYTRKIQPSAKTPFLKQTSEIKQLFMAQPTFYGFLLISCLSYPILTFLGKLIPIWFAKQGVSGEWVAWYNIAFGLGSLVTGLVVSYILASVHHVRIMQYSMLILAFVLLAMSQFMQPIHIVVLTLSFGFFNALNRIARTNWMHHTVPMQQRGRIDGGLGMFATTIQSLSYVFIAFLASYSIEEYGFLVVAMIMLIASVWMLRLGSKLTKELELATQ